ncbi:MAG: Trigger factor [Firmicutes bacterium ADurb.Bin262]|nr:MAG: Trigger factor [Firmicutes bacterium ADurb.Bin262]
MSLQSSEQVETNVKLLEIAVDAETFKAELVKTYAKKKKQITVPGFRKGKAPMHIIERIYGANFFFEDALEALYPQAVSGAYEEAGIEAVDAPFDFELKEMSREQGILFTIKVTVKPEIELGSYKGLAGHKHAAEATQEQINAEIESRREKNVRIVSVDDRPAQTGDIAVIDYEGFVDGVPFEGGKAEKHSLTLGSGSFIPGFEEGVEGHSVGEEFDIDVTFPEDYSEPMAGKKAVFHVKINELKWKDYPALDDEFAKDLGCDTFEELKSQIEKEITLRNEEHQQEHFEEQIMTALAAEVQGEIPPVMFENEAKENKERFSERLSSQGMKLDMYLMYLGKTPEEFDAEMLEQATGRVRLRLALEKVAELEHIEALEEDYEASYAEIAAMYSMEVDKIKAILTKEQLEKDILLKKARKFVVDHAVVETQHDAHGQADGKKEKAKKKAADTADKPKTAKSGAARKPKEAD